MHDPDRPTQETLRDDGGGPSKPPRQSAPALFLLLECADSSAGSARHSLANIDEVLLGRGQERDAARVVEDGVRRLRLQVADRRMSVKHARIVRREGVFHLEDLGSTNGSRVDDKSVTEQPLEDGAVIELGHTFFVFRAQLESRVTEQGDLVAAALSALPRGFATLLPEHAEGFERLGRIAKSELAVLLLGPTGSGKDVLARTVHELSGRSGAFVAINCGALPETLLESQLFGHVRGAFSGATRDETGFVRAAHRGTLFLDEIGDLPDSSQAALLRVLQEGEVTPLGSTRSIPVEVRVIAATHAPIDELVERKAFRADLYARLAGFVFRVPPLRGRMEDLGLLVGQLSAELAEGAAPSRLAPEAMRALLAHDWPHNTRELRQSLAAARVLAAGGTIERAHLPSTVTEARRRPSAESERPPTGDRLREVLIERFRESEGNVSEVARKMGKARVQIQRWMKRFGIEPAEYREGGRPESPGDPE